MELTQVLKISPLPNFLVKLFLIKLKYELNLCNRDRVID